MSLDFIDRKKNVFLYVFRYQVHDHSSYSILISNIFSNESQLTLLFLCINSTEIIRDFHANAYVNLGPSPLKVYKEV